MHCFTLSTILDYIVLHFTTLYHAVLYCIVLQETNRVLHCTDLHCSTKPSTKLHCTQLHSCTSAVQLIKLQWSNLHCSPVGYAALQEQWFLVSSVSLSKETTGIASKCVVTGIILHTVLWTMTKGCGIPSPECLSSQPAHSLDPRSESS